MRMTVAQFDPERVASILGRDLHSRLFPSHLELVPQLNEVYELELAFLESQVLRDEEIIRNGAYFARVGETFTRHYLMCRGEPVRLPQYSSSRLRSFFQTNLFKTGYATHGLFPYRGKFHPQMIKGLLNVMGLKPGETVLDPMMGSGTVLIEASLMGINSVGVDASPFCKFMTEAKLDGLTVPLKPIRLALKNCQKVFKYFTGLVGQPLSGSKARLNYGQEKFSVFEPFAPATGYLSVLNDICDEPIPPQAYRLLLLAYLDSAGYAERSDRKSPFEQFRAILERYLFVIEKIQHILTGMEGELAPAKPLVGDARNLPLANASVDGIVFSPPYSFAIDYVENDSFHLGFLGVNVDELREQMIGLRGRNLRQKFELYKKDMERVLSECARTLRPERICTIVVGTNNNQLSKILNCSAEDVQGIDEMLIEMGRPFGLHLVRKLSRQITGIANTMRTEYIVLLQRR